MKDKWSAEKELNKEAWLENNLEKHTLSPPHATFEKFTLTEKLKN